MSALRFPWLWWGLGWLLVAGVVTGSLLPGDFMPLPDANDKVLHAASYGVLTLWFSGLAVRTRGLLTIALSMFVLGALLDVLQGSVSWRTFDLRDVAANGGGILVALVIARLLLAGWWVRVERLFPV